LKNALKYFLHKLFGFEKYLFLFSRFKIYTLKRDKKENDFFYFLNLFPENANVLDIGANIGIMTVHLAKKLKAGIVYSFEPIPSNIKTLKRIVAFFKLKNVRIFEMALGNENGEIKMVVPVVNSVKMQGLSHVVHKSIPENNEGDTFKVPIKKLDELDELKSNAVTISGIKIDVENFEYFVLEGGKEFLKKQHPVIYIELWENENREKCFRLAQELGYEIYIVKNNQLKQFDSKTDQTQNFIFKFTPQNSILQSV